MASGQISCVIDFLRRRVGCPDEPVLSDGELLQRFISRRDTSSFEALLRRHAGMVWSVCRRILGSQQDAEDAFQATFLVLLRRATSVVPRDMVGNWLYGVARQTALKARGMGAKRHARERQVTPMPEPVAAEEERHEELLAVLDRELGRLPDKYRAAVVLCDLEGKTRKEAAQQLKVPEGTVSSRLTTARALLAKRLGRQGFTVTGAALTALLSSRLAACAAPAPLLTTTLRLVSAWSLGEAALSGASGKVAGLAQAVLKTMLLTKLKVLGGTLLLVSTMVLGGVMLASGHDEASQPKGSASAEDSVKKDVTERIRGIVVDEAGKGVADVEVAPLDSRRGRPTRSAQDGTFMLALDKEAQRTLTLVAREQNGARQGYFAHHDGPLLSLIRVTLRKPRTITVTVSDPAGRPAAGASVGAVTIGWLKKITSALAGKDGRAKFQVPADAPLQYVYATKVGLGLDYVIYRGRGKKLASNATVPSEQEGPIKLQLTEARAVQVRILNDRQEPVAGVPVYPWYVERPKKGGSFNLSGLEEFGVLTNSVGVATFPMIPADNLSKITFWARADNYFAPERPTWDPRSASNGITGVLVPLQPVRGKVTLADGSPARGAEVMVTGAGYQWDSFHGTAHCDANGAFEIRVYPDQYCMFVAVKDRLASPPEMRVVRAGAPVEPVKLVLQPATRVHGIVTVGKSRKPFPRQHLTLYQNDNNHYYRLPKGEQLPDLKDTRRGIGTYIFRNARSDKQGRFEFFAGPGSYYIIGPATAKRPTFQINGEKELEFNLHVEAPDRGVVSGRVALKNNPQRGMAEATVWGVSPSIGGGFLEAVTSADGEFRASRAPARMFVGANSADRLYAGIVQIKNEDSSIVIPVSPAASARGRLLDADTGKALPDEQIDYGVQINNDDGTFSKNFGGSARTNVLGEFTVTGMSLGWKFALDHVKEHHPDGQPRSWDSIGSVTPHKAAVIDLGDIKVKMPNGTANIDQIVDRVMLIRQSPEERLDKKLREARQEDGRVLLLAVPRTGDLCRHFFNLYFGRGAETDERTLFPLLAKYRVLGLDATAGEPLEMIRPLLDKLKLPAPDADGATLAILERDGRPLASAAAAKLLSGTQLDVRKLADFLREHEPALPDAEKLLADALARARTENKHVLLQYGGNLGTPCVLLSRFFERNKALLAKDFVYLALDTRFKNASAIMRRLQKEPLALPGVLILDGQGKSLANSGNIGFPTESEGTAHFERMLRRATRRLTDAEVARIVKSFGEDP